MPNNGNGLPLHQLSLAESHEERLTRVEGSLQEVAVSIGKMETSQDFMVKSLESSSKTIIEKLEKIDGKFDSFEARLSPIELLDKERRTRRKNIKGVLMALVIAAGSAVATAFGTWIWSLLTKV